MSFEIIPDDVLWLILKDVILFNCKRARYFLQNMFAPVSYKDIVLDLEHHNGRDEIGHHRNSSIAREVLIPLAQIHDKIKHCIKRRCMWYTNGCWDFKPNAFGLTDNLKE